MRDLPSVLGELVRRVRYLVVRGRAGAELDEEMQLHVALREARLVEGGASPAEAHYAARRRFGNRTSLRERSRDMWGLTWLDDTLTDLRFALRRFRARPGFALATILVAALGIGATTAVFSAIDAALIRPLPFAHPEELVALVQVGIPMDVAEPQNRVPNGPHVLDIADAARMPNVFARVGAYAAGGLNLDDAANPRRVRVGVITAHLFSLLGVRPDGGREFTDDEGRPHGPRSVILSDALWRAAFGGSDVLGKSISLNSQRYTVVGIMPRAFSFPNESDLWIPLTVPATTETFSAFRGYLPSRTIARLAPGVSLAAANNQLVARWRQLVHTGSATSTPYLDRMIAELQSTGAIVSIRKLLVGGLRFPFVMLMGAALLLLLIACSNVANLLLSDAAARGREMALRELLGASRSRIVRQLLAESLALAAAGTILGLTLAPAVMHVLRAMMPANLAGVAPATLDLRVLAFAAALAVLTGVIFGLSPSIVAARAKDATWTIRSSGGGTLGGVGRGRRVLITLELALTVVLLVASGLMLRSFERVLAQQSGMQAEHVGTLELSLPNVPRTVALTKVHAILARLDADPDIAAVGAVNDLPLLTPGGIGLTVRPDGASSPVPDSMRFAGYLTASGGYFAAMGIPLLRGRTFTENDDSPTAPVAVINTTMARTFWPNTDPVGKTFHTVYPDPVVVVGVVADVHEYSLETTARPQMYFPVDGESPRNLAIVARSILAPPVLLSRLREAVHTADPGQAVYDVRMMDDVVANSVAPRRTDTTLIALFAGTALVLAAFGVYAVVSYGVTRRARELGIRAALGATGQDIAALIAREMLWVTTLGLTIGLAGAWAVARVLSAMLYGVSGHDPLTFAVVPLVLAVPAAIATLVPARRAMRVDPVVVMRQE
ncbi:MAG TPA: ABC transporter permease [Gemmatimonadaceae bacterium]|nr:ABC transporter permease [Gemmatimonadaceae bacterium]